MQILLGTGQSQFVVGDAPQAISNRRLAGRELRRVADDDAIASQARFVVGDEFGQMDATDFLLAFNQEFELQRQLSLAFDPGLSRFQMR